MNRTAKQQTDIPTSRDACSLALASGEVMPHPPELLGDRRKERERRELEAKNEEENASSDEEMRPGAVAVTGGFTGPTGPSALSEPRGPSASEPSLITAELAEPSQEDEELRRRMQELENNFEQIISGAVTGTVVVENSGGGDDDQNAAPSPIGRKGIRFWIGAALVLLLVVGVILGVVIPLTTNNNKDKDSLSNNSAVTPTKAPTTKAPTAAPTATTTATPTKSPAPTACTSRECLFGEILLQHEVSGAEALRDESSPQFRALRWLANDDPMVLDLDSTPTLFERYILAVLFFATSAEGWLDQRNFLSASSVCEWNNGQTQDSLELRGAACNDDHLVVDLILRKSKHEELPVFNSKFRIDSIAHICLPFCLIR
jgi:hypothetical protein